MNCRCLSPILLLAFAAPALYAQGTLADYQRAHDLQDKAKDLVLDEPGPPHWIGDTHHFWYAHSVKGGAEYMLVDGDGASKKVAFDHAKLTEAVNKATGEHYTPQTLPFQPGIGRPGAAARRGAGGPPQTAPLNFVDDEKAIEFGVKGSMYKCDLQAYTCNKTGPIRPPENGRRGAAPYAEPNPEDVSPEGPGGDPTDGLAWQPPAPQEGDNGRPGREPQRACAVSHDRQGQRERPAPQEPARMGVGSQFPDQLPPTPPETCNSFDGKWQAYIQDFNVFLKPETGKGEPVQLSFDGSEKNYYSLRTLAWSPDSKKLAAYHTVPGFDREIMYIDSSPADQVQPKHMTLHYAKPGDPVDIAYPVLFDVDSRKGISRSTTRSFRTPTPSPRRCGGRTAALSPSSTTSADIRSTR